MNVGAFLTKAARVHPTRVAVTDGSRVLRYAESSTRRRRPSPTACGAEVTRPAIASLSSWPTGWSTSRCCLACSRAGLVAVPVNAKLHASELGFILEHARPRAVVYSAKTSDTVEAGLLATAGVERIDVDRQGPSSLAAIAADGDAAGFADTEVDADDAAWMFYTSGTTGRPKGAMLSHRNLCTSAINALADICDFQPEDVVLHVAPLSHGSGLYALPSIARAAKNIIYVGGSFDAEDVLATAARERVTIMAFLAPTMIHMLLEAGREHMVPFPRFGASSMAAARSTPGWRRRRSSGSARCSCSSTGWVSRR